MESTRIFYVRLSLILLTVLTFTAPGAAQKKETALLCGNVEKSKIDAPKSEYDRPDKQWQFAFEEGCCTLAGTSNTQNKELEKNLTTFIGDAERTYGQEDGICENLSDDQKPQSDLKLACDATLFPLVLSVETSFDTHTECCCSSCRCFGDPVCQSFHKDTSYTDSQYEDFDTWILCDGRSSKNCLVTKEVCEKEKDYNGNTCVFEENAPIYGIRSPSIATQRELDQAIENGDDLSKNRCKYRPHKAWSKNPPEACKVNRWDSFKYGSQCKPPEGSSNPLTMYAIEDKFNFTIYQQDRGYIDRVEITTACNDITYSLTVEDCLKGKGWTKDGEGEDVIKFHQHPYSQLAGGRWSFLDYSSGVTGDVTCYANGVEYDEEGNVVESYVPRFNVEHLNDALWRWNENENGMYVHPLEGYCVNREFAVGSATSPFKEELDIKCTDPTKRNLQFTRLTQFREICRDSILPPEIHECSKDFCNEFIDETPHLSNSEKESRKTDCYKLMNAADDIIGSNKEKYDVRPIGWPRSYQQGFCHTVLCSSDEKYCIDYTDCYDSMIPGQAPTPRPTKNEQTCREIYEKCEEPFLRPFETIDDVKEPVRQAIREFTLNKLPLWNRKSNDFIGDVTVDESSYPDNVLDCEAELPICVDVSEPNQDKPSLDPDERGAVLQYYDKVKEEWVDFQAFPEYDKSKRCYVKNYRGLDFGKDKHPEIFNNRIRMIQRERKYEKLEVTRCGVTHIPKMMFRLREELQENPPICPLCIHKDVKKSKELFEDKIKDNALYASASSCCQLCNPDLIPDYETTTNPDEQFASRWYDTTIEKICEANVDFSGDCDTDTKTNGAELEIQLRWNKEFNNCCLNCHAFGDPVIVDFVGNKEKWAVCHARDESGDLNKCPDYEEERCTDTENCEWRPQRENWPLLIGTYGSPCRPLKEDVVPLYYKERDGEIIMVNASQDNRGIIKSIFLSYFNINEDREPKEWMIDDNCNSEGEKNGYKKEKLNSGPDRKYIFNKWVDVEVTVVCFPQEDQRGLSILISDEDELYDTHAEFLEIQNTNSDFKAAGVCPDIVDYDFGENHPTATLLNLAGPCEMRPNLDRLESYRAMCDKYGLSVTTDFQISECLDTFCNESNPDFVHRVDTSTSECKNDLKYSKDNWSMRSRDKFVKKLCEYITLNDMQQDECYDKIKENIINGMATYFAIRGEFDLWTKRNHGLGRKIESGKFCRDYFDFRLQDLRDPNLVPNLPNYCCEGFDRTLRHEFNTNGIESPDHRFVPGVYLQYCDYINSVSECFDSDSDNHHFPWNKRSAKPWKTFEYIPFDTCFQKQEITDNGKVTFDGSGKVIFKYTIEEEDYKRVFNRPIRVHQTDVNPIKELPFPKGLSPVKGEGNECDTNTGVDVKFRFSLSK